MTDYPAWRFHKSGVTAVVNEEEDKELGPDWYGYLPEGFVVPKDAHYRGNIPDSLKKSKTLTLPKKNGHHNRA
jgi:hypothetical protein